MKRSDYKDKKELERLDKINNERVETTKKRVVHAIRLLNNPISLLMEERRADNDLEDIAHAVNLIDVAEEEMKYACQWFEWDLGICDNLNDACADIGECLALLLEEDNEEYDPMMAGCCGHDGLVKLSKALAILIRWFNDDADVSEV